MVERIAILDFDVHLGNGTENIFRGDRRVLICSSFQYPLYPGNNPGSVPGHIVNCALSPGAGGAEFRKAVSEHWLPALEAFAPQMIFISAGFDGHRQDQLANWALVESDYNWITHQLKAVATTWSKGRIVSALEGGYELHALGRSVVAHLKALSDL